MHDTTDQISRPRPFCFWFCLKTGEHAVIKRATSVSFLAITSNINHTTIFWPTTSSWQMMTYDDRASSSSRRKTEGSSLLLVPFNCSWSGVDIHYDEWCRGVRRNDDVLCVLWHRTSWWHQIEEMYRLQIGSILQRYMSEETSTSA